MPLLQLCVECGRAVPRRIRSRCPECARRYTRAESTRKRKKWQHKVWTSQRWERTRAAVLARDGYRCTRCRVTPPGARGLQAHHTLPIAEHDSSTWFDTSTIITLCSSCHGRDDGTRSATGRFFEPRGADSPPFGVSLPDGGERRRDG